MSIRPIHTSFKEKTHGGYPNTHDAFLGELKDAYDAEKQLIKALPKLAKAATSPESAPGLRDHLEETNGHVEQLEQVFESLDEKAKGKHCDGIAGIIEEGKTRWEKTSRAHARRRPHRLGPAGRALRDGGVRHPGRMGEGDGPHRRGRTLQEILDEEKQPTRN